MTRCARLAVPDTIGMQIGLTGASGVLGRRLADALSHPDDAVVSFAGDVRDGESVRDWVSALDIVVHAAAVVPVQTVDERLDDAIAANVGGTANVARAVSDAEGCRMVYLSTSHVYAPKSSPLKENDPTEPSSLYGMTKLQGEEWVRLLTDRHLIIRIFSFFDIWQHPPFLVPSLRLRLLQSPVNSTLELIGGGSERDLIDSQWIANVCALLIKGKHTGTVNCGTGRGYSVLSIARNLARSLGRSDVSWQPTGEINEDRIIADVENLEERIGALPPFDLPAALAQYAGSFLLEKMAG